MNWSESSAAKCRWSKYTEEMFKNWDIIWDQSTIPTAQTQTHFVEFVAAKEGKLAYMKYTYPSIITRDKLDRMSDDERRRSISLKVEVFDDTNDFKSWIEHKNDNRLRKIVVQ